MLDRIYLESERLMDLENKSIKRPNSISQIRKEGRDRKREDTFKYRLRDESKKKHKKKEQEEEKLESEVDGGVIVSPSLSNLIDENKIISKLVTDKFVNNPKIKKNINFDEDKIIESILEK
ncbi:hypothetical protein ACQPU1_02515 [Clostridium paraputrificum]|uniref:hypothetical protein n=1 Tax=Clostridium TaxID=1485 RepID=UPI003D347302